VSKYRIRFKAAKEPIFAYLVNPELEPPTVITEFTKYPESEPMEEDDVAAELPDGFSSTSCKSERNFPFFTNQWIIISTLFVYS